ncbi:MAG: RsfS/YbeB/iojap family protein [Treponema sp.]|jgi:ribosome-associated protein|nr:RsfS/YbeB/iojap family protein [Treponema sp.]
MDVTLQANEPFTGTADPRDVALALGALLRDHRALDVVVLDLRECNSWTSFFVIATATSLSHLQGLERHIKDFCRERDLEILRRSPRSRLAAPDNRWSSGDQRSSDDRSSDDWRLTDLGSIVVHLMSERARNFYELERLWSAAPRILP